MKKTLATISITFGCLTTILALCLGAMVIATSCEAIATASATKVVAYEQTAQTQINADASVEIARINADASVEIAQTNADATKKTSWAFLGMTIWQTATLIWTVAIALFLMYRKGWI